MVGCNGTNWENFRISAATRIIKRDIRLQVKFEARIVNRIVKMNRGSTRNRLNILRCGKICLRLNLLNIF